jgi:hypothetical protein
MKRERDNTVEKNKRQKSEKRAPMLMLYADEIRQIMSFMTVGETIMFALSNKSIYETVTAVMKDYYPQTKEMTNWSIVNAYKMAVSTPKHEQVQNQMVKVQAVNIDLKEAIKEYEKFETELPLLPEFNVKVINDCESYQELLARLSGAVYVEEIDVGFREDDYSALKGKLKWPKKADHWYNKKYVGLKVIPVEKAANMKQVVEDADLEYAKGNGYYQLTAKEKVTDNKKIIVIDKVDQTLFRDDDALEEIGVEREKGFTLHPHNEYHIFIQSTSHNRKLPKGSYVLYETGDAEEDDEDQDGSEDEDDEEGTGDKSITIPVLEHLKKIHLSCSNDEDSDNTALYQLLQVAPNLEELSFVYVHSPDDKMLQALAKYTPKLKRLYVTGDDACTPSATYFSDDGMLQFLSDVKLEELRLENSAGITGSLFKNIGMHADNLKTLFINRCAYEDHLEKESDSYFGGGVMSNLKEVIITGSWQYFGEEFAKTLSQCAPNAQLLKLDFNPEKIYSPAFYAKVVQGLEHLRDLYVNIPFEDPNVVSGSALEDHFRMLYGDNYAERFTTDDAQEEEEEEIHLEDLKAEVPALIKAISTRNHLVVLEVSELLDRKVPFTIDELKSFTMPSLKEYCGQEDSSEEWLDAFHSAFPNLEVIKSIIPLSYLQKNNSYWPNLRQVLTENGRIENCQFLSRDQWGKQLDERAQYIQRWMESKKSIIIQQ